MRQGTMKIALVAALGLLASASQASAVTIGQVAPGATLLCAANFDHTQQSVASGNSYIVPSTGGAVN